MRVVIRRLTVKLRGRWIRPDTRRGRTLSRSARGAEPQASHGPLQRWLGGRRPIEALDKEPFILAHSFQTLVGLQFAHDFSLIPVEYDRKDQKRQDHNQLGTLTENAPL
jgi:hypothetical protein